MRRFGILAGVVVIVALSSGCQHVYGPKPWTSVVASEELAKASLQYYWRTQLVLEPGESLRNLWQIDLDVYALTSTNRLISIDALSGSPRWTLKIAEPTQVVFAPCHANDVSLPQQTGLLEVTEPNTIPRLKPFNAVIINTLTTALVIERNSGTVMRTINFQFAANTGGSCDGTYFYVASVTGRYYAIRLSEGLQEWEMSGDDLISVKPVYYNHRLYVATHAGTFMCVSPNLAADRHLWTQKTDGPITGEFVVDARGCFVPSQDFRLYAYDAPSGGELWKYVMQGPLRTAAQVSARSVFQYADHDRFYALDLASGRKRWDNPSDRLVLGSLGNNVAVLTADLRLVLTHEITGEASYSVPMTGLSLFVPNASRPAIYAGSDDGKVVCIRQAKSGPLKPGMLSESASQPATSQAASAPASAPAAAPAETPAATPTETPAATPEATPATPEATPAAPEATPAQP